MTKGKAHYSFEKCCWKKARIGLVAALYSPFESQGSPAKDARSADFFNGIETRLCDSLQLTEVQVILTFSPSSKTSTFSGIRRAARRVTKEPPKPGVNRSFQRFPTE